MLNLNKKHNLSTKNKLEHQQILSDRQALIEVKDENKVVKVLTILSVGWLVSILIILGLVIANISLAHRKDIYVEQIDGSTKTAREEDRNYRSDEVIKTTLSNWLYLTWEWNTAIPSSNLKDSGIEIGKPAERLRVPSKTYLASYLIEEGFRQEFLKKIATIIPNTVYQEQVNNTTSNIIIYHLSNPKRIDDNTYSINVIYTRTDLENGREQSETKSSQTFLLETIEPHQLVLGKNEPSLFRKQLNELLKNGLIISDIKNYSPREKT